MNARKAAIVAAAISLAFLSLIAVARADVYLSPTGSDSNSCTQTAPCRTIERGQTAASSGAWVRLGPGDYSAEGHTTTLSKDGINYGRVIGQARPRVLGKTSVSGDSVKINNWLVDGPTGNVNGNAGCTAHPGESVLIDVSGANDVVEFSQIRESYGNAGIFVSGVVNARIANNNVHDNGGFGVCGLGLENGQHGIYWSSGTGVVENNRIVHNWTRGVQLYSKPTGVTVANNTIAWNGRAGIIQGGSSGSNVAANNIVAGNAWNGQCGIYAYAGTLLVTHDLLWHNVSSDTCGGNVSNDGTSVTADPLFVGADVDSPPAPLDKNRRWTTAEANAPNLHLTASSPAIGLADPAYASANDFDGQVRDAEPDAGAYEYP
jgi:hypothetical protein